MSLMPTVGTLSGSRLRYAVSSLHTDGRFPIGRPTAIVRSASRAGLLKHARGCPMPKLLPPHCYDCGRPFWPLELPWARTRAGVLRGVCYGCALVRGDE